MPVVAAHGHGRRPPLSLTRQLRKEGPRLDVGVLAGADTGVNHPRGANLVLMAVGLKMCVSVPLYIEVRVAVIRVASVGARIAGAGQVPGRTFGTSGRRHRTESFAEIWPSNPVIYFIDADAAGGGGEVVRRSARQSETVQIGGAGR